MCGMQRALDRLLDRSATKKLQPFFDKAAVSEVKVESRRASIQMLAEISSHHLSTNHLGERVQLAFEARRPA